MLINNFTDKPTKITEFAFLFSESGHIAFQYGPYCIAKAAILTAKMAAFATH